MIKLTKVTIKVFVILIVKYILRIIIIRFLKSYDHKISAMLNYSTIQHDKICTFEGLKQRILIFQMNLEEFGTSKLFSVKNDQFDHAENNLKILENKSIMNKLKNH